MNYIIELLQDNLEMENKYRAMHSQMLGDDTYIPEGSSSWALSESVRLANERIPQLEAAINILKNQQQ